MHRRKRYKFAKFPVDVLQEATRVLWQGLSKDELKVPATTTLEVEVDDALWAHDSEAEFFADYRRSTKDATYSQTRTARALRLNMYGSDTTLTVTAESRTTIQSVFEVFEQNLASSVHPPPPVPKPRIFIGHGRSPAWRDLKDHLHDRHGFDVEAYEIGARAGHAVRDILEDMLKKSAFALLVMTGDDERNGEPAARQNVVHEAGLFQGRLGFARAVILIEDGTKTFSNIDGIERIRFSAGNIREAFGDVLATIRREFPTGA